MELHSNIERYSENQALVTRSCSVSIPGMMELTLRQIEVIRAVMITGTIQGAATAEADHKIERVTP